MMKFSGMAWARRARVLAVLATASASVIAAGFLVVSSLVSPARPAPVITGYPSDQVTLTSATFRFTYSTTGTALKCSLDSASFTACDSGISYTGLADGSHTFRVQAGSGGITSYTWLVVPPSPIIIAAPARLSANTNPEFQFIDAEPGVGFTCWLDSGPRMNCTGDTDHDGDRVFGGEWRFHNLAPGPHCFAVSATDRFGHPGPPTRYCWAIIGAPPQSFTVGGDLGTPLYPGISRPLDLTFTNTGSAPITIPAGNISARNITITSNAPGCASSNFAVAQGLTAAVTIPARQTTPVSLSALKVPQAQWPVIEMIDTKTNQDACQGTKLTLTYAGIEATG